jgi:hypothetical protein
MWRQWSILESALSFSYGISGGKAYASCISRVGLDPAGILTVSHWGVWKCDILNDIVALSSYRSDAQSMASNTGHTSNGDIDAAGDSYAIILVVDNGVGEDHIVGGGEIKAVRVVGCCERSTGCVGCL